LVTLLAAVDAFYPFAVTLDVSTVWGDLKRAQWIPLQEGLQGFLRHSIAEKMLLFAALCHLMGRSLAYRHVPSFLGVRAWLLCVLLAASMEGGKLFVVGRTPNVEDVIAGSLGALLGLLLIPILARLPLIRKHPVEVLLGLAVLLIAYDELGRFDWVVSPDAVVAQTARIEWLPFASYYGADLHKVLFDLGKKALLLSAFGFLVAIHRAAALSPRHCWVPVAWGFGVGVMLEASQLLQVSCTPSITDVLVFGASAWAGAALFERYNTIVGEC